MNWLIYYYFSMGIIVGYCVGRAVEQYLQRHKKYGETKGQITRH
jgi:hypothetical protein